MKRSTAQYRRRGRPTPADSAESKQFLTRREEEVLAEQIARVARDGYHIGATLVREIAHHIACQRNAPGLVREHDRQHIENSLPGKNWVESGFIIRNPHLQASWERQATRTRRKSHVYDDIDAWLELLGPCLAKTKMLAENVYQVATLVGALKPPGVVAHLLSGDAAVHLAEANNDHKVVTVIECVSTSGDLLSPLIIQPPRDDAQNSHYLTSTCKHGASKEGCLTRDVVLRWITELFEPQTRDRACGRPRVVVADALASHLSDVLKTFCTQQNIIICKATSKHAQRVRKVHIDREDLVEALCSGYRSAFKSTESRRRRDLVSLYERVRLDASESLGLSIHLADGDIACKTPESSTEWDEVLHEHEDDAHATPLTTVDTIKLIGDVEDDLLHGSYDMMARDRMKRLIDTMKILLKANDE